jgi:transcription antitermination factor NusG
MPILPAEPEMFPDHLWQGEFPAADSQRWWCLHTKPRQEKMAARVLRKRRICHYLPQVTHTQRTPGGRKIQSLIPLFPGYLFLHGDDYQCVEAMHGNHLANILAVPDQAALEGDLRQIYQMLASGLPIVPESTHGVGSKIRIVSGPLRGIVGTITRRSGADRFVAIVHFLGRGATIDLRDWQVEPA